MLVKIPGTQLVRDTNSMALINTDIAAKREYNSKVQIEQTKRNEINSMKADIKEIKALLLKLLENKNNG